MTAHRSRLVAVVAALGVAVALAPQVGAVASSPPGAPRAPRAPGVAGALAEPPLVAPATPVYANRTVERFDDEGWWRRWGIASAPLNTSLPRAGRGGRALEITFGKGTHDGTTFFRDTGVSDAVHVQYRMQLSPSWDPSASATNVKLPGFGQPRRTRRGACLSACGGMPADGITSYSARSDVHESGAPGWYVYRPGASLRFPSYGAGRRWTAPAFVPGRWYTIDLFLAMNTPGLADGTLRAEIDGVQVAEQHDIVFRLTDTLHVGAAWFDFHYGGAGRVPHDMWVRLDDVVVEW